MKKNLRLFLYLFFNLFFTLFFLPQKIHASFFEPFPITENYGDFGNHAYATQWNPTATYLAVGGVNSPTDVTIYKWKENFLYPEDAVSFGSGAYAVSWSPDGYYLAVGGSYGNNALIIYKWNGQELTLTTSKYHGTQVNALAWSPDGNTLAVGGICSPKNLILYNWNGSSTLTPITSLSFETQVNALAWHPNGTKLAIGGINDTRDVILYGWNGSTLTSLQTIDFGAGANALTWTHTGAFLAVGGNNGSSSVIIYRLDGSTLTPAPGISPIAFGTQANTLAWSFDDQLLAIGGNNPGSDLLVYWWVPVAANYLYPIASSQTSYGNGVYSINWTPYSDYLAVAGNNGANDLTIYKNHNYLNGTKNNITLTDQYVFSDGGTAIGSVNFKNGCSSANSGYLNLALTEPFSGPLNINNLPLILNSDLYLNSSFTLAPNDTYIYGQGRTIYLGEDLVIPDNIGIYFETNTTIDGNGHSIILGNRSQIILNVNLDQNFTLTLRNLTLKNTLNTQANPTASCYSENGLIGKIALDNVKLELADDFYFTSGKLFIHNDVAFTGTSKFIYQSPSQSYIAKNSTLYFGPHTTFKYNPSSTNKSLVAMQDTSSSIHLDGCTLQLTHTGLRLAKGQMYLENSVTLTAPYREHSYDMNFTFSKNYGPEGSTVKSVAWSPNGNYLAVGGYSPTSGQEIQIFSFNGTVLGNIPTACKDFGQEVDSVAWSPDGNYLAVVGVNPTDSTNEIQIFSFDGTTLTKIPTACAHYGSQAISVAWSPDGNYLAVGGHGPTDTKELQVFRFNSGLETLTPMPGAFKDFGAYIFSVAWSPDGNYLAVGGYAPTDGNEIQVFRFDGGLETLTPMPGAFKDFGVFVLSIAWSPNGKYLAVGGQDANDGNGLQVFSFNNISETLTQLPGASLPINIVSAVAWSPDNSSLATYISVFDFNGATLTEIKHMDISAQIITWRGDGNYIAIGNFNVDAQHNQIETYRADFFTHRQSASTGLILGHSALGADHNLNIDVLSGANINQHCFVNFDNSYID